MRTNVCYTNKAEDQKEKVVQCIEWPSEDTITEAALSSSLVTVDTPEVAQHATPSIILRRLSLICYTEEWSSRRGHPGE
jgi:hypothetical protein